MAIIGLIEGIAEATATITKAFSSSKMVRKTGCRSRPTLEFPLCRFVAFDNQAT
jgi:hypothetical protein